MTREQAIQIAKQELEYFNLAPKINACEITEAWRQWIDFYEFVISAIGTRAEREKNEPLTLEQLRELDGKPIWVQSVHGSDGHWVVVHIGPMGAYAGNGEFTCWFEEPLNYLPYRYRVQSSNMEEQK